MNLLHLLSASCVGYRRIVRSVQKVKMLARLAEGSRGCHQEKRLSACQTSETVQLSGIGFAKFQQTYGPPVGKTFPVENSLV